MITLKLAISMKKTSVLFILMLPFWYLSGLQAQDNNTDHFGPELPEKYAERPQDPYIPVSRSAQPKSPAYFANLRLDDLIINYDGEIVEDDDHLVNLVSLTPINQSVPIEIVRQGRRVRLNVKVGNRKHFEPINQD